MRHVPDSNEMSENKEVPRRLAPEWESAAVQKRPSGESAALWYIVTDIYNTSIEEENRIFTNHCSERNLRIWPLPNRTCVLLSRYKSALRQAEAQ